MSTLSKLIWRLSTNRDLKIIEIICDLWTSSWSRWRILTVSPDKILKMLRPIFWQNRKQPNWRLRRRRRTTTTALNRNAGNVRFLLNNYEALSQNTLSKTVNLFEIDWTVNEKLWPEQDQIEHICTTCPRWEVAGDVISSENVDTWRYYICVVFGIAASEDFEKIEISHLQTNKN